MTRPTFADLFNLQPKQKADLKNDQVDLKPDLRCDQVDLKPDLKCDQPDLRRDQVDLKPDLKCDQVDLKLEIRRDQPDLDLKDQPTRVEIISSLEKSDNLATKFSRLENISTQEIISSLENISTQQENILQEIKTVKGGTFIPNTILDSLGEVLTSAEQLVFIHLYRLSYGFNKSQCLVSLERLGQRTGMSGRNVQNVVKNLERKGLIKKTGYNMGSGKQQGIIFSVQNVSDKGSLEIISSLENISRLEIISTIKSDDHDDLKKHDHQSETMMIYQTLTGNKSWTRSDQAAYEKIKHLAINEISQLIKSTLEKAHQKPNSLAYFVKAYETPIQANPMQKTAVKSKIAAIVERKREAHVGAKYTIADLTYDVKSECLKEGIIFDNDLLNEVLEKK